MSRIFISHSSANNAAALALAGWLEANGWGDYFLDFDSSRGIAPGERWMAALAAAVDRCEAVIFLVSPAWRDSKYCFAEFFEAKKLGKRIFGVLVETIPLDQLPDQMTSVWQLCDLTHVDDPASFTVEKPPLLSETVVKFSRAGLEALAIGLRKAGLDASTFVWPPEKQPERSPYPGLLAFDEPDAAVFFGREAAIVRGIDQMRLVRERDVEQLFVILGASGAGKSSFLRAGLLPRLKRDSDHFRVLPTIRPENQAISGSQGLLNSLEKLFATSEQAMSRAQVREQLASIGLAGMLRKIQSTRQNADHTAGPAEPTFILPIDQAEELFATDSQEESRAFLDCINALHQNLLPTQSNAGSQRLRILLVLTIRSDSLPKLQEQPLLQGMSPVLFSLPAMPVSEFKAVIEGPARRHSESVKPLVITPELTEKLIQDAQGADALPLLAFTLERLYREFITPQGTQIGCKEYQQIGGVQGIINAAVKHAFEDPNRFPVIPSQREEQEELLRQVFPHIATVDPDTGNDTGNWKRRVALRKDLPPQADVLVSRLIEQRLLLTDTRPVNDGGTPVEVIEVAHEALLRQWEILERWLREFAEALSVAALIRRSANDWLRGNRDEVLLVHTGHRLDAAEAVLSDERLKHPFEVADKEYLAACRQRDRQEQEERENHLRQIAEQQYDTKISIILFQSSLKIMLCLVLITALVMLAGNFQQTREVNMQKSLLLASAAETAADENRYDQSLRLAVLAAKESWLRPAHPYAAAILARAADASTLRSIFVEQKNFVEQKDFSTFASFSFDGRRGFIMSKDNKTVWVGDAETGQAVGKPMKHDDPVKSVSFSPPDGKWVVTTSGKNARVWDVGTGHPVGVPMKHDNQVTSASFSPDGRRVVTASGNNVQVWDAETGKAVGEPMEHDYGVTSASFSPDGKRVVTSSGDNTARVWNAETGQAVGKPMKHDDPVKSVSFSPPDGKWVVTTSGKNARVWDVGTGHPVGVPMKHEIEVISASFNPNGKRVFTVASSWGKAALWDVETGKPMKHGFVDSSASFSPDGRWVVNVSRNNAQVWDTETGKPVGVPMKHDELVFSAHFSPDGRRVVTASLDKTARVWDAETGKAVGEPMEHDYGVLSASFSPDGKRVVTASLDGWVRVWDFQNSRTVGETIKRDVSRFASFSPDGRRVVTTSGNNVQVWDAETGKAVGEPMEHDYGVLSASFSPDGKRVVTSSEDNTARVWNAETGQAVGAPMKHDGQVEFASFSPDGKRVVTASGKNARVWDVGTGHPVGVPMKHDFYVYWDNSASFSPDGRRVVTASGNNVQVWDAETGKAVGAPMEHGGRVTSARFSPDGKRVVTSSEDNTARVWNAETGQAVRNPMKHDEWVTSASFSPDGRRVVTVSGLKLQVWDVYWSSFDQPDTLIAKACSRKLSGNVRFITKADIAKARILEDEEFNHKDVCDNWLLPLNWPDWKRRFSHVYEDIIQGLGRISR